MRVRSRRFNTYFYWAVVPIDGTPAELAAQSERADATVSQVTVRLAEIWSQEVLPEVKVHLRDVPLVVVPSDVHLWLAQQGAPASRPHNPARPLGPARTLQQHIKAVVG